MSYFRSFYLDYVFFWFFHPFSSYFPTFLFYIFESRKRSYSSWNWGLYYVTSYVVCHDAMTPCFLDLWSQNDLTSRSLKSDLQRNFWLTLILFIIHVFTRRSVIRLIIWCFINFVSANCIKIVFRIRIYSSWLTR